MPDGPVAAAVSVWVEAPEPGAAVNMTVTVAVPLTVRSTVTVTLTVTTAVPGTATVSVGWQRDLCPSRSYCCVAHALCGYQTHTSCLHHAEI